MPIAVFDVDRTLILGTSAEELLIHALRKAGLLPIHKVLGSLWQVAIRLHRGWQAAVHYKSYYLKGLSPEQVESLIPQVMTESLLPRLSPRLMALWPYLREAGYHIYLVSGTLGPIVERLVTVLGADGGLGSTLETAEGRYTGRIIELHPYHHGKSEALERLVHGLNVDWSASLAFGDSWADVPLLSRFGHPVAVNPGFFMRFRLRRRRGWFMIRDRAGFQGPLEVDPLLGLLQAEPA